MILDYYHAALQTLDKTEKTVRELPVLRAGLEKSVHALSSVWNHYREKQASVYLENLWQLEMVKDFCEKHEETLKDTPEKPLLEDIRYILPRFNKVFSAVYGLLLYANVSDVNFLKAAAFRQALLLLGEKIRLIKH